MVIIAMHNFSFLLYFWTIP